MIDPKDYTPLFLLAVSLDGDLRQTSLLANVQEHELAIVATRLHWPERFSALRETRDTEGPDAMARELNRLTNLNQSQRARDLLDKALDHFSGLSVSDLTSVVTEKSSNHSAKLLVDLVKAAETVQNLTYRALGDTATERAADRSMLGPGRLAATSRGMSPAESLTSALDSPKPPEEVPEPPEPKRGPGRPPGSKSKPKRAGRPPGRRNKTRVDPGLAARADRLKGALDAAPVSLPTFE